MTSHHLEFVVQPQPDLVTCGPTCLHAVYRYYGDTVSLEQVIREVRSLPGGGTLAVSLGCHALERGFRAEIWSYNLHVFDPTWFQPRVDITERLRAQARVKKDAKLKYATDAYLEFLGRGGRLRHQELNGRLIRKFLKKQLPILTGLSATYLYACAREVGDAYDDVEGEPAGHFVVLCGYDRKRREVSVADPLHDNPLYGTRYYNVGMDRVLNAILLGILTYDANLLIITPTESEK